MGHGPRPHPFAGVRPAGAWGFTGGGGGGLTSRTGWWGVGTNEVRADSCNEARSFRRTLDLFRFSFRFVMCWY